jgi:Protein of unknown function (DUF3822)
LRQLFHIENGIIENGQHVLSLRLGENHFSFVITNKSGSEIRQLAYCAIDEWSENELEGIFINYPSLKNSFYDVLVSYDLPQSVLVPSENYKSEDAGLIINIAGNKGSHVNIVSELVTGWQVYNVYAVAKEIQEWVIRKFPSARSRHQYSLAINNINAVDSGSLAIDFRTAAFSVIIARSSNLLLAQSYEYSTPEDVLYYLLKICQQYSLSQQDVKLQLTGLIDKQSLLYRELNQYFINTDFREPNWNAGNEYPAHFFTSLNDLARCAL